jgi:hypothetical protein
MPSRFLTLVIVSFWLATTGWFVAREFATRWHTGDPPPYTIEFADEALKNAPAVRWKLFRNGNQIGTVRTGLQYNEADDSFRLVAESSRIDVLNARWIQVSARDLKTELRVNRDGELRGMRTGVTLDIQDMAVRVEVAAEVIGRRIERTCRINSPLGKFAPDLQPVAYTRGSVLNPLHPVNRVAGLKPGQRWQVPLVDPLGDALKAALQEAVARQLGREMPAAPVDAASRFLAGEVLPATRELDWEHGVHECFVIEYRGDEYTARTWVRVADGLVLRQEAQSTDEELVLQRE